jgi:hypothetical protein
MSLPQNLANSESGIEFLEIVFRLFRLSPHFVPMDMNAEFAKSWEEYFDRACNNFQKSWPRFSHKTSPQAMGSFQDRVEAAAINAWSNENNRSVFIAGDMAYAALRGMYFSLRKQLYQRGTRKTFTKEECIVLLNALCSETVVARTHRQPAQALNAQLKEALARAKGFQIEALRDAAKRCANAVGSQSLQDSDDSESI